MDAAGDFITIAVSNSDTKVLAAVNSLSDIHVINPTLKLVKANIEKEGGGNLTAEFPLIHITEPDSLFINLINMVGTAAPAEFTNQIFAS